MPTPPRIPHEFQVILTKSDSVWVVTGAGAYKLDMKTGKMTDWIGEHPILDRDLSALAAATEFLGRTEAVRGTEELQLQVGKFITALLKEMDTEVNKTAKVA
jgi:hypothetical protein